MNDRANQLVLGLFSLCTQSIYYRCVLSLTNQWQPDGRLQFTAVMLHVRGGVKK